MGQKIFCDLCQNEILNGSECVKLFYETHNPFKYTGHNYHKDCFNIKFSTDVSIARV